MFPTAIILPEQSVAADKAGLAVNKKGLTLKELLSQTSHHNAKVRRGIFILLELLSLFRCLYVWILASLILDSRNFVCLRPTENLQIKYF